MSHEAYLHEDRKISHQLGTLLIGHLSFPSLVSTAMYCKVCKVFNVLGKRHYLARCKMSSILHNVRAIGSFAKCRLPDGKNVGLMHSYAWLQFPIVFNSTRLFGHGMSASCVCFNAVSQRNDAAQVNPRTCDWSDAEEDQEGEAEEDDEELPGSPVSHVAISSFSQL